MENKDIRLVLYTACLNAMERKDGLDQIRKQQDSLDKLINTVNSSTTEESPELDVDEEIEIIVRQAHDDVKEKHEKSVFKWARTTGN